MYLLTQFTWELDAILDTSKVFTHYEPGVMKVSSDSGRFFIIYVNEVGELHGIYHAD